MRHIFTAAILICLFSCQEAVTSDKSLVSSSKIVPSVFDNGDRIFLKLPTKNQDTITVFTDTGGGFTAVYPNAIERLRLKDKVTEVEFDGEKENIMYAEDIFQDIDYFPYMNRYHKKIIKKHFFFVPPAEFVEANDDEQSEGFFGQYFFMDKIWSFDYPQQRVTLHTNLTLSEDDLNTQKVGFKKDTWGKPEYGHPSFYMKVEDEEIPMLFDTGATFNLSKGARENLNTKKNIGGSFIAKSVYEDWKTRHPDWKVIDGGDLIAENGKEYPFDMIEVPKILLGKIEVGPVWFSVRPDQAWSKGMIRSMDKVVKGALGGSALKYLTATIDYRNELLNFEK